MPDTGIPAPATPALTVADVLSKAADLIEQHGWTQNEWKTPDGCLCVEGAITDAGACSRYVDADYTPAANFLMNHLAKNGFRLLGGGLPTWNDAPGRTQAEVVAKLREVAALARSEGK